jgi:dTMP kinase
MHPETEALLMFAARREHISEVIEPALAKGAYVVSDRFADASYAYQCGGRGVDFEKMRLLEQWALGDLQPDITLLFDVPVNVSLQRLAKARSPDKFEQEGADFFTRIRDAYLRRAQQYPHRFRIINSDQPLEDVIKSLDRIISSI